MNGELILPSCFKSNSSALLKLPVHCLLEHSLKPLQHFNFKTQGCSQYESSCYPQLDLLVVNCVRIWGNKKSVPHLEVYSLTILQIMRVVLFSWLHLKNLTNSPQQKAWGSWRLAQLIKTVSGFPLSQMLIISCSHEPSVGRYLSIDGCSPHSHTSFVWIHFCIISYSQLHLGLPSSPLFTGFRMERSV